MTQWIPASLIASLSLVCIANAEETPGSGESTRQWLELQKSGAQASVEPRPLEGEVARRNYERYLKSFEHGIPAQFDTDDRDSVSR